jgi:hypothetical protein
VLGLVVLLCGALASGTSLLVYLFRQNDIVDLLATVDSEGKGLCLRASTYIPTSHPQSTRGLCEYTGTERVVPQDEHVNSVPLRQLMYGCEYQRDGKTYRKSPDQDLDSLLRYMQSPNPGEEPTCCRLLILRPLGSRRTLF